MAEQKSHGVATGGLLQIHVAVLLFGLAGLFGKYIALPAALITLGRVLFAAVAIGIVMATTGRTFRLQRPCAPALLIALPRWCSRQRRYVLLQREKGRARLNTRRSMARMKKLLCGGGCFWFRARAEGAQQAFEGCMERFGDRGFVLQFAHQQCRCFESG